MHGQLSLGRQAALSIQTVWAFTKACAPKCESSRPYPMFLTPPTGTRGSDAVTPLMNTPPVYKSRAILRARSTFLVHMLPLSPNWLAFAASTAASTSGTRVIVATVQTSPRRRQASLESHHSARWARRRHPCRPWACRHRAHVRPPRCCFLLACVGNREGRRVPLAPSGLLGPSDRRP